MLEILDVNDEGNEKIVSPTKIKVVGCGGCGGNAVNNMVDAGIQGVQFIALNTDLQHLSVSKADYKIQIGKKITGGLGAGMHPEIGEEAAKEELETIKKLLEGTDMVFITAGMGGGTGTGSAPVVANIAKELGILTVAVVTTPFDFEGDVRAEFASEGIKKLRKEVDSLIVIPNQRVFEGPDKKPSVPQAFKIIDDILRQGVQGISEIITKTGLVNRDFKDVETVMKGQGDALLGIGVAEGENRAIDAANKAINNNLLADTHIDGAKNILIKISGNENIGLEECNEIVDGITASAAKGVKLLWGLYIEPELGDKISVTVVATGFNSPNAVLENFDEPHIEEKEAANSDFLDVGSFEKVLNGGFSSSQNEKTGMSEDSRNNGSQKVLPSISAAAAIAGVQKNENYSSAMDSSSRASAAIQPPPNFKNTGDINQPACWRNLPKSIDLTKK
ncbi:cell division protein FtsZ [Treponema pectinovorum]|uniref:cell division protein FtsZ n=1 Tax=Treponema pectinovorum TaxID=164 RepID=UPI0011CCAE2E|nr:cell division protein FtsZ [Treponema pectinovorum]